MKVIWFIAKSIIIRAFSFVVGAFLAGAFSAMFEVEISNPHMYRIMGRLFIGLEIAFWNTKVTGRRKGGIYDMVNKPAEHDPARLEENEEIITDSENAEDKENQSFKPDLEPAEKDNVPVVEDFSNRMSGSLVALYKETHDVKYDEEYRRRLRKIGYSDAQAANMFMFELMVLKHDSRANLIDSQYIYRPMLDYRSMPLQQQDSWYVEHQMFLMSEIVKLWDEAEYVWTNSNKYLEDEEIRKRVYTLTRYGGAKLFLSYLRMISEKSHTDIKLVQAYARAEQDLLYIYRWKQEGIEYPY